MDQLGNRDNIDVRLGGIYALERIARESEEDQGPIVEILTASVRQHTGDAAQPATDDPPATDIQAILTVLGRRNVSHDPVPPWRLRLPRVNLSNADLSGARLEGAYLSGARLERGYLIDVHLEGADLSDAHLEGANLSRAYLQGANLTGANLENATLTKADLEDADLSYARLDGAHLIRTYLSGAIVDNTNFKGAMVLDDDGAPVYLDDRPFREDRIVDSRLPHRTSPGLAQDILRDGGPEPDIADSSETAS